MFRLGRFGFQSTVARGAGGHSAGLPQRFASFAGQTGFPGVYLVFRAVASWLTLYTARAKLKIR